MAQLNRLRELRAALPALRMRIPVECMLCRTRCGGGLCGPCQAAVCASMASTPRCPRCDLALHKTPVAVCPEAALTQAGSRPRAASCPDCSHRPPAFERVVSAFDYQWPGELLIQRLKQQGRFGSAPVLAGLLAERCELLGNSERTLVVAVPSSLRSLTLRGYNPAAEVGRALAGRLGLAWRPGLLCRTREGHRQKTLGRQARQESVEDLYECAAEVRDSEILVVDDVMTTGSTLSAIARVLKGAGANQVYGAVVARTPSRSEGGASL